MTIDNSDLENTSEVVESTEVEFGPEYLEKLEFLFSEIPHRKETEAMRGIAKVPCIWKEGYTLIFTDYVADAGVFGNRHSPLYVWLCDDVLQIGLSAPLERTTAKSSNTPLFIPALKALIDKLFESPGTVDQVNYSIYFTQWKYRITLQDFAYLIKREWLTTSLPVNLRFSQMNLRFSHLSQAQLWTFLSLALDGEQYVLGVMSRDAVKCAAMGHDLPVKLFGHQGQGYMDSKVTLIPEESLISAMIRMREHVTEIKSHLSRRLLEPEAL